MASIHVEVVYALQAEQRIVHLRLDASARAIDAVLASGLVAGEPGLSRERLSVGIFGRGVGRDTLLQEGDRVEIYRPLFADPKAVRRERADVRGMPGGKTSRGSAG